jgi:hypothetical protein
MLRIAQKMRITIGGLVLEPSLEGGEQVLSALTECALQFTHSYQGAKSNTSIFDSRQTASKEIHTEAIALVSNIIAYARVPNSQSLPTLTDLSGLPIDAGWKVGLITAGVTVLDAPLAKERIAEEIIAHALRFCRGGFFFVSLPDAIDNMPIARVFDSCETTETTTSSYHLVIARPKAGHYVFSLLSTGSSLFGLAHRSADQYEATLRAIVMLAIEKLH